MSFFKKLVVGGLIVAGFVAGGWFAIAALNVSLGLAAQKMQQHALKRQERRNNRFKDVQPPRGENRIPVAYGQSFTGGVITDAFLSPDRKKLWFCIVLSEKTGPKISDGRDSEFTIRRLLYNDQRVILQNDGITFDRLQNISTAAEDTNVRGLIKVWCFDGNSATPRRIGAGTQPTLPAWQVMPGWNQTNNQMNGLVFAIVSVEYNAQKGVTQLEDLQFALFNSMTLPGDVIFDYMTSERYGAGIKVEDINVA